MAACMFLSVAGHAQQAALFDRFEYSGHDASFAQPLPSGSYRNPVLAGFSPDPAVARVGDRYYLANSSFAYFPGIPVYESGDLVHWTLRSHVVERRDEMDFDGVDMSRGIFAPSISWHDGRFYVIAVAIDRGGTFIASARDAAGPWSNPTWLHGIGGIDPSLFFDDDGKAYVVYNDVPAEGSRYPGHRAIWIQPFDIARLAPVGPRGMLLDGGVDPSAHPIWIEGPHLYKRDGWYYLMCAEGGTGPQHSEVVLRSRSVSGPYVAYAQNPILTQRDLPADRANPIVDAGHADLVQMDDGSWWSVFLASRAYGGTHYNTGRETFLLPVTWKDGWPVILPHHTAIPQIVPGPHAMPHDVAQAPHSGNFTWRDDFDKPVLDASWLYVRVPKQGWADVLSHPGKLAIHPLADDLDTPRNPSYLARPQQHMDFDASVTLEVPGQQGIEAGIATFQNSHDWFTLGVRRDDGTLHIVLRHCRGDDKKSLASVDVPAGTRTLSLRISADGGDYAFAYRAGQDWQWLLRHVDGTVLSTDVAGGFIGTTIGPYARLTHSP
ncbi:glycoside hydrolase family 43 protein [Rhodanobacter sp. DHB23]|uniref:glycoside hydrolase family 43 protein n=1 Tax=Rhodanobacter sp. DHB23 TaxID=2775923 RepID=UPI0017809FB7|nr:glycoside hydrolase family 43 protein [Rhodanobacter sp. DHB23]MBD8871333.1 glycoside hydrolase family 43 protein [Rhodanobacter sp. DHB23]